MRVVNMYLTEGILLVVFHINQLARCLASYMLNLIVKLFSEPCGSEQINYF